MSSQLLTFLGICFQDLSRCSSSRLWEKYTPFQSGSPLGPSQLPVLPLGPSSNRLKAFKFPTAEQQLPRGNPSVVATQLEA